MWFVAIHLDRMQRDCSFKTLNRSLLWPSHRKTYRRSDLATEDERVVSASCGTTAFIAFLIGHPLVVANACDCCAILCRKGEAADMEREAVESSDSITLAVKCFMPSAPTPHRRRIQFFVFRWISSMVTAYGRSVMYICLVEVPLFILVERFW